MNALIVEYKSVLSKIDELLLLGAHMSDDVRREIAWARREARLSLLNNKKTEAQRTIARLRSLFEKLENAERDRFPF